MNRPVPGAPATTGAESMSQVVTPSAPRGCVEVMMGLFRACLHERQLPVTHQREVVAETLFESGRHLSAEDVAERLRERGEQVGKATIYRTLNLLVEVELATEHDFDEGFKRYEMKVGATHHDHLICTSCGQVTEFQRSELEGIQRDVARDHGFMPYSRQLKIYGLCSSCERSGGDQEMQRVG